MNVDLRQLSQSSFEKKLTTGHGCISELEIESVPRCGDEVRCWMPQWVQLHGIRAKGKRCLKVITYINHWLTSTPSRS